MLINSYAKINLYLDVLKKRPDGYHEVDTIFVTVDLHDSLKFALTKKPGIKILSNIPELASEKNLIYRIAERILSDFGIKTGIEINLHKEIPLSAGLGGGSSNAAMTFLAMRDLLELEMSSDYLEHTAAMYGSDINFFFHGGCARGSSRGEQITLLPDLKETQLLLVNPGIAVSSREAYELSDMITTAELKKGMWYNKLEAGVIKKYPVIGKLIEKLKDLEAQEAMMSGSGSTCIGLFPDIDRLDKAMNYFIEKSTWCRKVKIMGRRHYQECIQSLS